MGNWVRFKVNASLLDWTLKDVRWHKKLHVLVMTWPINLIKSTTNSHKKKAICITMSWLRRKTSFLLMGLFLLCIRSSRLKNWNQEEMSIANDMETRESLSTVCKQQTRRWINSNKVFITSVCNYGLLIFSIKCTQSVCN